MAACRPHVAWIVCVLAASTSTALAEPCPTNTMFVAGRGSYATSDPVFDSGSGGARFAYDLPNGVYSIGVSFSSGSASGTVADVYTITGLPSGTPMDLIAEIRFEGSFTMSCTPVGHCGQAELIVDLVQGTATSSVEWDFFRSQPIRQYHARLPFTVYAGTPFPLAVTLRASRFLNAGMFVTGRLLISGLPAGALLSSCQGFTNDLATPASPSTWGRLKSIYR